MKTVRMFTLTMVFALLLVLTLSVSAQDGTTIDILNVRTAPDASAALITTINPGVPVVIEGRNNIGNWLLIHTADNGARGWVASRYVNFGEGVELALLPVTEEQLAAPAPAADAPPPASSDAPPAPAAAVPAAASSALGTTISDLNVRIDPSTNNDAIGTIPRGAVVVIEGRSDVGNWLLVHAAGIRGWVATRYVNFGDGVSLNALPVTGEVVVAGGPIPVDTNAAPQPQPQTEGAGALATLYSQMNVRQGPGTDHKIVISLPAKTIIVVESRNAVGDWVIIHTADNTARGWVASRYVNFGGAFNVNSLPIVNEIIGQAQLNASDVSSSLPGDSANQMYEQLWNTPILSNMNSPKAHEIWVRGFNRGNRAQVFMLLGDSVTATQPFLKGFGNGDYNLGGYGYLQPTIDWFNGVSPRPGIPNSWVDYSISAQSGFTTGAVFDGLWVDPNQCSEAPLYCEYNQTHPSVAIILFGPVDMRILDPYTFQANMYRMVKDLIDRDVIPVLNTFAAHPGFDRDKGLLFNTIILNAARDYDVPLINLWRATQELPDYGIKTDDPVHLTQGPTFFSFNGEENQYGVTMRNLVTLQALDEIRKNILTRYP